MQESRTAAWVTAASVLHAVVLGALLLVPLRRLERPAPGEPQPIEIDIARVDESRDLTRHPGTPEDLSGAPGFRVKVSASQATALQPREIASGTTNEAPAAATAAVASSQPAHSGSGESAAGAPAAAGSGGGVVAIPFTAAELGIGGPNPFLPRAATMGSSEAPRRPAERAMRDALRERDLALGLGPEGPVVKALSEATSVSVAPVRGRAVFLVRADGDGEVSGIELIDSEGGAGWLDAGRIAVKALRGKKLKMPRDARALSMRIEVRSDWKLPNGESPGGSGFGVRQDESKNPEMTFPDPSNIGAKPRRVVQTRVLSAQVL